MNSATPIRSRKVRRVLKLESRAARLLDRHDRALACARELLRRGMELKQAAQAAELTMTGTEIEELRRVRAGTPQ